MFQAIGAGSVERAGLQWAPQAPTECQQVVQLGAGGWAEDREGRRGQGGARSHGVGHWKENLGKG